MDPSDKDLLTRHNSYLKNKLHMPNLKDHLTGVLEQDVVDDIFDKEDRNQCSYMVKKLCMGDLHTIRKFLRILHEAGFASVAKELSEKRDLAVVKAEEKAGREATDRDAKEIRDQLRTRRGLYSSPAVAKGMRPSSLAGQVQFSSDHKPRTPPLKGRPPRRAPTEPDFPEDEPNGVGEASGGIQGDLKILKKKVAEHCDTVGENFHKQKLQIKLLQDKVVEKDRLIKSLENKQVQHETSEEEHKKHIQQLQEQIKDGKSELSTLQDQLTCERERDRRLAGTSRSTGFPVVSNTDYNQLRAENSRNIQEVEKWKNRCQKLERH